MNLETIELTEQAYNDIAAILDNNFGEVTLESLNDETFIIFVAAVIKASYNIGFRDGHASAQLTKK